MCKNWQREEFNSNHFGHSNKSDHGKRNLFLGLSYLFILKFRNPKQDCVENVFMTLHKDIVSIT